MQYTFRAMIEIDLSVSEDAVQALLDGARTNDVVKPSDGKRSAGTSPDAGRQ